MRAQPDQKITVFTWIFIIVWLGSAVVTVNAKLLGGRVYVCFCFTGLIWMLVITLDNRIRHGYS